MHLVQSQGHVLIAEQARHLRALRDGYSGIEPENLLDAMMRSQTRIVDLETANLSNPRLPAAGRQRAKAAIAWAGADRALLRQHKALLPSALR